MKKTFLAILFLTASVTLIVVSCDNGKTASAATAETMSNDALVKRGDYLVNSIGCDDCHSPKKMGAHGPEIIPELRFSGYPADRPVGKVDTGSIMKGWSMFGPDFTNTAGMWGMSFAGNISSDETGIGNWTEEQFMTALRKGKYKGLEGSRDLLPPMPWFVYKNMSDEDIRSIFAYLKTTKPVRNIVPAPKPLSEL